MFFDPAGKKIKGPGGGEEIKGRATIYTPGFLSFLSLSASPETLNSVAKKLVVAAHNLAGQVVAIYEAIHSADLSGFARFVGDSLAAFEDAVRVTRPLDVKMFSKLTKTAMKFILHQREMAQELGRLTSFLDFFFDK